MNVCPSCKSSLEPFEITCHNCGQAVSDQSVPAISDIAPSREELHESYRSWLTRGKECLENNNLEEACNALREAIRRSRVLDDPQENEIEARKLLAEALEKLGKAPEAADQYRIIAQEATTGPLREHWLKKSQDLLASSPVAFDELFRKEEFRTLLEEEVRYVPLYCSGCHRLLAEAEVYGFRRGLGVTVHCWCGMDSRPVAKLDGRHMTAFQSGQAMTSGQRARAIQVAGTDLGQAKKRSTACLLALATGWCGGHKFYLGETVAGWIYLFWFWTFVPFLLSLYEALILSQMTLVTFNMTYNLDLILARILPEEQYAPAKLDVFSLELGEGPAAEEVAPNGTGRLEM
jgi:TM2 domain-containing membrane protein YozV